MASCTGSKKDNSQNSTEPSDSTESAEIAIDSMELVRRDKLMEITCRLQFTTGGGIASDSINASISQHILGLGRNSNVREAMHQYMKQTYEQNEPEVKEMQAQGEYFAGMVYSFDNAGRFLDDNPESVITYETESYIYTGGAHGYNSLTYMNFSRKTGHLITLDEVLDLSKKEHIIQLLLQDLMQQANCKSIQQLEDEGYISIRDIDVTGNFHMGSCGITFVYNPYEIACYAMGRQSVTLTYEQLKPYMK